MTIEEILKQAKRDWGFETVEAIKAKIREIDLVDKGELLNSVRSEQEDTLDGDINFKMTDYGKFQDEGVNPEGLALYQTPYGFNGNWKGMAFYLKDWATARGLNEYAVAYTIQNYDGIKPKLFFKSVIRSRVENQLVQKLEQAYLDYLNNQLGQ